MDRREALHPGAQLCFPGLTCHIVGEMGRGSNAIVYRAWYADQHAPDERHEVLVKELFPLHPGGGITRGPDGGIVRAPEGEDAYQIHRRSFEAGNAAHLALLRAQPDGVGSNLNTYSLNGTLYTLLGFGGGRSLKEDMAGPAASLRPLAERVIKLLDALEGFHQCGLLHLDIAPDNIMLLGRGRRQRVMLIDFNSCRRVGDVDGDSSVFSVKAGYTAPEIRGGRLRDVGPCSDLFSVAAVFYRGIAGQALTPFQMTRPQPPDVSRCPCMAGQPDTVQAWTRGILKRGLSALPGRRYQTVGEMRDDLMELLDRIDGVGITHSALWEAGRRNVQRIVRDNPSFAFIGAPEGLYPSNAKLDGRVAPVGEQIDRLMAAGQSALMTAGGGIGKTTAMLRTALERSRTYSTDKPAVAYLSLYGWQSGERDYILNRILETLRFKPETRTFEDARKALMDLLDQPLSVAGRTGPALLLMLDGLNEVEGDRQPLTDEIRRLAEKRGLCILAATRTEESSLPFQRLELAELEEADVRRALSDAGLLMPEDTEVRSLLRTPLMLSIFIRSSLAGQRQQTLRTQDELLSGYFAALRDKQTRSMEDDERARWQIEAALDYVLPSLAREMRRRNRALEDARLLPTVEACWKLFDKRLLCRAFPRWIGHSAAIRGDARNAEEWYGRIVHDILWKRMGLLIRDEQGRYQIAHQTIAEYLLGVDRQNRRRIDRRRRARAALIACAAVVGLLGAYWAYDGWLKPKPPTPYEEKLADSVMSRSAVAYAAAGQQYQALKDLAECALQTPEAFPEAWSRYEMSTQTPALPADTAAELLRALLDSGEVMPWSGEPMDDKSALALMSLFEEREEEYGEYARWLHFAMTDEQAKAHFAADYPALLVDLLEVDADINATLYQIVCEPHLAGLYADGSVARQSYDRMIAGVPEQNEHLTDTTDANVLKRNLGNLYGLRAQRRDGIIASGVKGMYRRKAGE